jgi:hypothetical protein
MPVQESSLFKSYAVVDHTLTGQQALDAAGDSAYLVIVFGDGRYAVATPKDLSGKLNGWKRQGALDLPLGEFYARHPNALELYFKPVVQRDSSKAEDQARIAGLKDGEILVVLAGSDLAGLLVGGKTFRGAQARKPAGATLGTLSGGEPEAAGAEPGEAEGPRYINVEVRDRSKRVYDVKTRPLEKDATYELAFDIDTRLRETAAAASRFADDKAFEQGEEEIELTVRLASDDFKIRPEQQTLYVPRKGKSLNEASFYITPLHDGSGVINAVFLKGNTFIQVMSLTLHTGPIFAAKTLGHDVEAAFALDKTRDLNLVITEVGDGFQVIMTGPVGAIAKLPINTTYLDSIVHDVRAALYNVVHMDVNGDKPFQSGIDVKPAVSAEAMKILAGAGYDLFRKIFRGPGHDVQAKLLGDRLREMARKQSLKIQIFSQRFTLPWGLMYVGDDPDAPEAEMFLGLKHIIEHIPLQPEMRVTERIIDSCDGLKVGLNVNTEIDAQMGYPLVGEQLKYWEARKKAGDASVEVRKTGDDVLKAMKSETTPDQILYFYCHAISRALGEKEGPDSSVLVFANKQKLTLGTLARYQDTPLPGAPLVFINACESAELSPLFYDGFVPYFMAKGARGVIGTECETPALFGVDWMKRFFDRLLKGEPLGQIMLDLRKEYYKDHNNPMGLLYALYVDGDTRVMCES